MFSSFQFPEAVVRRQWIILGTVADFASHLNFGRFRTVRMLADVYHYTLVLNYTTTPALVLCTAVI